MSHALPDRLTLHARADEVRAAVLEAQQVGDSVGLVPTMGALHQGHLSLVEAARCQCDRVVVSVFVNPTQFGPGEDLAAYPRDLERDCMLLKRCGACLVYAPSTDDVYAAGHDTVVDVGRVAEPWEGAARPTHFRGVATIVLKLFLIAPADRAYFGQKDYQQTLVVRQLVRDLNVPIDVCVCPTVREPDGLAMSSRNAYLNPEERRRATALWQSLQLAERMYDQGERDAAAVRRAMLARIAEVGGVQVEYLALLADGTVQEVATLDQPTVIAIAARVGSTRLIDNHRIG